MKDKKDIWGGKNMYQSQKSEEEIRKEQEEIRKKQQASLDALKKEIGKLQWRIYQTGRSVNDSVKRMVISLSSDFSYLKGLIKPEVKETEEDGQDKEEQRRREFEQKNSEFDRLKTVLDEKIKEAEALLDSMNIEEAPSLVKRLDLRMDMNIISTRHVRGAGEYVMEFYFDGNALDLNGEVIPDACSYRIETADVIKLQDKAYRDISVMNIICGDSNRKKFYDGSIYSRQGVLEELIEQNRYPTRKEMQIKKEEMGLFESNGQAVFVRKVGERQIHNQPMNMYLYIHRQYPQEPQIIYGQMELGSDDERYIGKMMSTMLDYNAVKEAVVKRGGYVGNISQRSLKQTFDPFIKGCMEAKSIADARRGKGLDDTGGER
jgi:hypothetical protein